jgi:hypothetical protein
MVRLSFDAACRQYVHRFTMEHVPQWALMPFRNGRYPAPQFRSDREWYEHTQFFPEPMATRRYCHTTGHTWPLGTALDQPYQPARKVSA